MHTKYAMRPNTYSQKDTQVELRKYCNYVVNNNIMGKVKCSEQIKQFIHKKVLGSSLRARIFPICSKELSNANDIIQFPLSR